MFNNLLRACSRAPGPILAALLLSACGASGAQIAATATEAQTTEAQTTQAPTTEAPTTEAPTTTIEGQTAGGRANPITDLSSLSVVDYRNVELGPLETPTFPLIKNENGFNKVPQAGQTYARFKVTATYVGQGTGTYSDFYFTCSLVGDKGTIYKPVAVADTGTGELQDLRAQPDVLSGGTMSGYVYYLIDSDDERILVMVESGDVKRFVDISV